MNILSLFVLVPLLMLLGLWIARNVNQVRGVMVAGSSVLLVLAAYLTVSYIGLRNGGATEEMLFTDSITWYAPLHIAYSVGVDGISVVMLLLSAIIVFTGTFASWKLKPLTKEYFLWFTLLSTGVFGFFISTDLFTMFMFYEVALIPMYLLIGVWGSGRKEYSAMKLTLMLMGGSAFLLIGILGIFYGAGAETMNVIEIAKLKIPTIPGIRRIGRTFPLPYMEPRRSRFGADCRIYAPRRGIDEIRRLRMLPCRNVPDAYRIGILGRLLPGVDYHFGGLRSVQRRCADRLEIHQRLLVGKPLRPGIVRPADGYACQLYRCHPADAEPRLDDGTLLCPHRYDLRTYAYP